jgi:hypothetical protein
MKLFTALQADEYMAAAAAEYHMCSVEGTAQR